MKIAIRAIISLLIVLWLGGILFFPIVAASAFGSLADTHAAGTIVGKCLRILNYEGLVAGVLIVILLAVAQIYDALPRSVAPSIIVTLVMLGLTAFLQFSIIPRMENYRIAAGGAINTALNDPNTIAFNRLHHTSVHVLMGTLLAGIVLVVLMAWNYPSATAGTLSEK